MQVYIICGLFALYTTAGTIRRYKIYIALTFGKDQLRIFFFGVSWRKTRNGVYCLIDMRLTHLMFFDYSLNLTRFVRQVDRHNLHTFKIFSRSNSQTNAIHTLKTDEEMWLTAFSTHSWRKGKNETSSRSAANLAWKQTFGAETKHKRRNRRMGSKLANTCVFGRALH